MKTETKQWIFLLLTLGVSILLAVLAMMSITNLFGDGELPNPIEGLVGYLVLTGLFSVPTAHIVNAVFNFFGIFSKEDLTNEK